MNPGLLQSVQKLRYDGLAGENSLDHLDTFDRLCALYKVNGVPMDAVKMMVFPFSLGNEAARWKREIPSDLVSTWEDVRKEFLSMFFPKQRTARFRAEISGFRQRNGEDFHDAWARLQGYIRSCTHHGFGRDAILGIFYRGCLSRYRELMDSSIGGSFSDFNEADGEELVVKVARNSRNGGDDECDRERSAAKGVNDLSNRMNKTTISQPRAREVNSFSRNENYDEEEAEELNAVENQQDNPNVPFSTTTTTIITQGTTMLQTGVITITTRDRISLKDNETKDTRDRWKNIREDQKSTRG